MRSSPYTFNLDQKDQFETTLHDLTNSLAAAQSFGEVLMMRVRSGKADDPKLVQSLLNELERASGIVQNVRRQTYRSGDTLECRDCGYTFVHRRASGKAASCRRCKSGNVERWQPNK